MKSEVYFIATKEVDDVETVKAKLIRLIQESRVLNCIEARDSVAIKIHFGEEANTGYVRPEYLAVINAKILEKGVHTFVADTNTLYRGRRMNSQDHLALACEHGFRPEIVGSKILIPDDTRKENISHIEINQKFIKVASIARIFTEADAVVCVSHFKGHLMTGFGGALKNMGMGCATRQGKLAQHSGVSPFIILHNCTGCGVCSEICPVKAISLRDKKAYFESSRCIGCASCIASCRYNAIEVNWEEGADAIQEKMVEYAKAALDKKKNKSVFINFAIKITKECDCLAKDDQRIAPDIGIFVSGDPVSIDKACLDSVNARCRKDILKEAHPRRDGLKQLIYAEQLDLGNLEYDLVEL